jgi:8-oxo-dGTP diphosphatase
MPSTVWAGVRVFVPDALGRILLVKHVHRTSEGHEEYWVPPGGGVEQMEMTAEAGVREVLEETGLVVEIENLLWTVEEKNSQGILLTNYFLAKRLTGELCLGYDPEFDDEHQVLKEIGFFSKEEISQMERVYPEVLYHEFWEVMEQGVCAHPWRERNSKGFGKR